MPRSSYQAIVLSKEEIENNEINFTHLMQATRWPKASTNPSADASGKDASPSFPASDSKTASNEALIERSAGITGAAVPPADEDAQPSRGCCCDLLDALGEKASDTAQQARETREAFLEQVRQLRSMLWCAMGSVIQWSVPAMAVLVSIFVQACSARLATLYYVRYMHRLDQIVGTHTGMPNPLADEWLLDRHRYDYPQKLQDIIASAVPQIDIPPYFWDLSLFPLTILCLCLVIMKRDVLMWTKLCVCFVVLDLGRAVCHVATVVPDSQGWSACKARLTNSGATPNALEEMKDMEINWRKSPWQSLLEILEVEVKGMRYCGDMLYSGQAFVMLLFTLGLLQAIRKHWPDHKHVRSFIALISLLCVFAGSLATLAARYHYTVDVFLALVLTVLWFDSRTVDDFCGWWEALVDNKKKEKIFVPTKPEETEAVSKIGILIDVVSFIAELGTTVYAAHTFYVTNHRYVAMIYAGSLSMVSFILMLFSLSVFEQDYELRELPICVRLPLALILGLTHTVFVFTQGLSFKRNKLMREVLIIKIFRSAVQSAPLACVQLYTMVSHEVKDFATFESADAWDRLNLLVPYLQMFCAFRTVGEAVTIFDSMNTSVLSDFVRNSLWKSLLVFARVSEVASRISVVVIIHVFLERSGFKFGGPILLGAEFVLLAILTRIFGVARTFLASCFAAMVSMPSNAYFFQRREEQRRLADMLFLARASELLICCASVLWYFKFHPGGMHSLLHFGSRHTGAVVLLLASLFTYFVNLAIWFQIRQVHLDDGQASLDEPSA